MEFVGTFVLVSDRLICERGVERNLITFQGTRNGKQNLAYTYHQFTIKKGKIRNHNETTAPYPTLEEKLSASWKQSLNGKKNT